MQAIHQDEDERSSSRGANSVDIIIYTERVGRCLERKYIRRFGDRVIGV